MKGNNNGDGVMAKPPRCKDVWYLKESQESSGRVLIIRAEIDFNEQALGVPSGRFFQTITHDAVPLYEFFELLLSLRRKNADLPISLQ